MMKNRVLLGVNVDHVATVREARGTDYPSVIEAVALAEQGGADAITIHLREDRRHIQDDDVRLLCQREGTRINLEMAVTEEMLAIAIERCPSESAWSREKARVDHRGWSGRHGQPQRNRRRRGAPGCGRDTCFPVYRSGP